MWKLIRCSEYGQRSELVSEELSSVETNSIHEFLVAVHEVSEELSSVETVILMI